MHFFSSIFRHRIFRHPVRVLKLVLLRSTPEANLKPKPATIQNTLGDPTLAIPALPLQPSQVTLVSPPGTGEPSKTVESEPEPVPHEVGALPEQSLSTPVSDTTQIPVPDQPTSTSTVQDALSDNFRFGILVVGKSGSGKSSIINASFKVNMSEAPPNGFGKISDGFRPRDNRYLIVHEYSGLDQRDLQTIKNLVVTGRDSNRPESERFHAIWICVSVFDLIDGQLDEEVKTILDVGVPVVFVFTKFDMFVSRVQSGTASEDHELEQASYTAYAACDRSCRSWFNESIGNMPAAIVSTEPVFGSLINKLITTTDQLIIAHSRDTLESSRAQKAQSRMSPVLLAWSISQRASHDVIMQAAIEVGRSKYWRGLSSDEDFAGYTLESYLSAIHTDIVEVWNFPDKDKYLLSKEFKAELFHFVEDLNRIIASLRPKRKNTKPPGVAASRMNDPYQNSNENICCVMGYIVDLTAILCTLFMSPGDVTTNKVQSAVNDFANSSCKSTIHTEISSFIAAEPALMYFEKDVVMEKVIDLIKQFCVPPHSDGS